MEVLRQMTNIFARSEQCSLKQLNGCINLCLLWIKLRLALCCVPVVFTRCNVRVQAIHISWRDQHNVDGLLGIGACAIFHLNLHKRHLFDITLKQAENTWSSLIYSIFRYEAIFLVKALDKSSKVLRLKQLKFHSFFFLYQTYKAPISVSNNTLLITGNDLVGSVQRFNNKTLILVQLNTKWAVKIPQFFIYLYKLINEVT